MRVALCSPFNSGPLRGNIITVQRIAHHLPAAGWEVDTIPLDSAGYQQLIERCRPDLLHAFHAFHSAPQARLQARRHGLPYLVTMTGSDLHDPAFYQHPTTIQALHDAAAITCFDTLAAERFTALFPQLADRATIIPQGVVPLDSRQPYPRPEGSFIILLPAALRPVKGILEAVASLTPLAAELPQLQLWLAGGDLDPQYAEHVRQQTVALPWVNLLGEIPHERMGDLFASCDLVLNNSHFEGGMANTLLEAMAAAKPVIASDVAGNRSLIAQNQTGWLFKNQHELHELIRQLVNDTCLRQSVGQHAQKNVMGQFSAQREATELAALYQKIRTSHRT